MTTMFSLQQLVELTGLPLRTIRYYIQLGLVDRPEGERRTATYHQQHLQQLLSIKHWSDAGLPLERIRGAGPTRKHRRDPTNHADARVIAQCGCSQRPSE